jgi:hypothetical protein
VVKGQTFQDWFINDYILNEVGRSPLVSGFFWDDVWNPTCNIHDQTKDTCVVRPVHDAALLSAPRGACCF